MAEQHHLNGERGPNDIESMAEDREAVAMERDLSHASADGDAMLRQPLLNTTSQMAAVGSNVYPIESLDYESVENDLFKEDWRSWKKVQIFQYIVLKWTLALFMGLATGLVGFFNNLSVENIAGFKLLLTTNYMLARS